MDSAVPSIMVRVVEGGRHAGAIPHGRWNPLASAYGAEDVGAALLGG